MKKIGLLIGIALLVSCEKYSYEEPDYDPFIEVLSSISTVEANYFNASKTVNITIASFSNLHSNSPLDNRSILAISKRDSIRIDTVYNEINPLEFEVFIDTLYYTDTLINMDTIFIVRPTTFRELISDTVPPTSDTLLIYYKIYDMEYRMDSIRMLFIENPTK